MTSSGNPLQESLDNQEKIITDKTGSTLQEINETEGRALQLAVESGGLEPGKKYHKPNNMAFCMVSKLSSICWIHCKKTYDS